MNMAMSAIVLLWIHIIVNLHGDISTLVDTDLIFPRLEDHVFCSL